MNTTKLHSPISASNAHIRCVCLAFYRNTKDLPNIDTPYSLEGTKAHEYVEYLVRKNLLHEDVEEPDHNKEMELCGADYLSFIKGKILENQKDFLKLLVEEKVYFDSFVPNGYGTCDLLIITRNKLIIIDYKFGKGIRQNASFKNEEGKIEPNYQLSLYALGAYLLYGIIGINEIELNIFQPRIDNISTYTITVDQLLEFAEFAKDKAIKNFSMKYKAHASSECKFCKAAALCKERAKIPLDVIRRIIGYEKQWN